MSVGAGGPASPDEPGADGPVPPGGGDRDQEPDALDVEIPDDLSGLDDLLASGAPAASGVAEDAPRSNTLPTDEAPNAGTAPSGTAPSGSAGPETSGPDGAPSEPVIALVVTQVAGARPLAAACALAGVDADVVPSPVGAIAVLRRTEDRATTARGAESISRALRAVPVVLLDRRQGRIEASRWAAGVREDDLPAGLVLSGAPEVLEDLLVGTLDVRDAPGVETSVGMSRWAAMRALAQGRRKPGAS